MAKIDDARLIWDAAMTLVQLDGEDLLKQNGEPARQLQIPGLFLLGSADGQLVDIWLRPGPKVFSAWRHAGGTFDLVNFKRGDWERLVIRVQ